MNADREALRDLLNAMDALSDGLAEAREMSGPRPASVAQFTGMGLVQRVATRAFIKAFEQLQDVTARTIRAILLIEQENLTGLTTRAIADRAESVGLIGSSDRWSLIVRLRNRLVHEYPLPPDQQLGRVIDVWDAHAGLLAVTATIQSFLHDHAYMDEQDD